MLIFLYFFSILKGLFSLTGIVSTSPNLAKARARRASKAEPLSVCAMLLFSSVMYMLFSVVYMLLHIVQSLTLYGIRTISAYQIDNGKTSRSVREWKKETKSKYAAFIEDKERLVQQLKKTQENVEREIIDIRKGNGLATLFNTIHDLRFSYFE